jgi:predicted Zn-dependent protease
VTHRKQARSILGRVVVLIASVAVRAQAASPQQGITPIAVQYAQAEQSFRAGDLARAEQLYSKLLESHGDEPLAWFRIGLIQQRRHSFRAALNAYDSALAWAPGESSEETTRVLAKVRFNRALLLLESAAKDLKGIAPGVLDRDLDATREAITARVDAALLAADATVTVDAPKSARATPPSSAKGFVYEVKRPVVTATPVEGEPRAANGWSAQGPPRVDGERATPAQKEIQP